MSDPQKLPSLLKPGRKVRGKVRRHNRPAQWEEVAAGLFLATKAAKLMRQLVRKHDCEFSKSEAAGYLGKPTLTVRGEGKRYVLRLFTEDELTGPRF